MADLKRYQSGADLKRYQSGADFKKSGSTADLKRYSSGAYGSGAFASGDFSMSKSKLGSSAYEHSQAYYEDSGVVDRANLARTLPLQYVESNIAKRIASDGFYTDFFMYIPFLALFMVFFLSGRDITVNHMAAASNKNIYMGNEFPDVAELQAIIGAQGASQNPIVPQDRVFDDIESAAHWHEWFRTVVVPGTWDCNEPDYSRSTLVKRGQMQYIGAMKMRVFLVKNDSCRVNTGYTGETNVIAALNATGTADGLPSECFTPFDDANMQVDPRCNIFNPALNSEPLWRFYFEAQDGGKRHTTGQMNLYPSGGYIATLPFNATCNEVRAFHDVVSGNDTACGIINDRETRFVILEWFQYAANTDTYMMNKFFFEMTTGGGWISNFQVRMFPVWTSRRLGMSIFDIVFFIFVLYFVYRLFYDWIDFYRRNKKILAFCFDLWNLLEVINISTLVAVCILRWTWWTKSRNSKIAFPFPSEYPADLDDLVLVFSAMIYANSFNVVITILKVLKYFQLNNRLNILTRTLSVSQQGIIGVLALFLFVVTGYAICGTILYGSHMFEFKNVNTAFSNLAFLLLGQFDYPQMRALQPVLTGFFFFSFVILGNFLLLNFIIAILSDGFASVSRDTALEPLDQTILNQIYRIQAALTLRNLKKLLELKRKGKTRSMLLREVHKYLSEHLDLISRHSPALLDSDIPMHRTDLKHWLPEQLYSDLGDQYVDLLWEDMVRDYGVDSESASYTLHKEVEEAVSQGMAQVIRKESTLLPLASLDSNIRAIEAKVDDMLGISGQSAGLKRSGSKYGSMRRHSKGGGSRRGSNFGGSSSAAFS